MQVITEKDMKQQIFPEATVIYYTSVHHKLPEQLESPNNDSAKHNKTKLVFLWTQSKNKRYTGEKHNISSSRRKTDFHLLSVGSPSEHLSFCPWQLWPKWPILRLSPVSPAGSPLDLASLKGQSFLFTVNCWLLSVLSLWLPYREHNSLDIYRSKGVPWLANTFMG